MSNVLKNVVDLETYSAVYAIISKYRADDIVSTSIAVDAIRQKFPECPCNDEELVGLILHAIAGKRIAVSFDHRVEPVMRPKVPSIVFLTMSAVIGLVALGRAPSSASRFKQISDGKQIVDRCVCFTASSGSQRPPKAAALPRRAQSSLRDLTSCVAQRVVSTWRWQRPLRLRLLVRGS
jgi:hypothetical protein